MAERFSIWPSISDMMSGLMLVFMFLTILYMAMVGEKQKAVVAMVDGSAAVTANVQDELKKEFGKDLGAWDAALLDDQTLRFKNPDVLFEIGSDKLTPTFKRILDELIPRYLKLIAKLGNAVKDVQIKGHTSKDWGRAKTLRTIYLNNLELSGRRSQAIIRYIFGKPYSKSYRSLIVSKFHPEGYAFSEPIKTDKGKVDPVASRRVEIHLQLNNQLDPSLVKELLESHVLAPTNKTPGTEKAKGGAKSSQGKGGPSSNQSPAGKSPKAAPSANQAPAPSAPKAAS